MKEGKAETPLTHRLCGVASRRKDTTAGLAAILRDACRGALLRGRDGISDLILRSGVFAASRRMDTTMDSRPSFETRAKCALLRMRSEISFAPRAKIPQSRAVMSARLPGSGRALVFFFELHAGATLPARAGKVIAWAKRLPKRVRIPATRHGSIATCRGGLTGSPKEETGCPQARKRT
jgi:hypothetical protein